jgi:hypothetical protein
MATQNISGESWKNENSPSTGPIHTILTIDRKPLDTHEQGQQRLSGRLKFNVAAGADGQVVIHALIETVVNSTPCASSIG